MIALTRLERSKALINFTALFWAGVISLLLSVPVSAYAGAAPDSFADLAKRLGPTVVNIYTTQTVKAPAQQMFPGMEGLPEQFRKMLPQLPHGGTLPQRELKKNSLGSGVIISADGYILTNNHVVQEADEIRVTLATYEGYEAELIGRDAKTDLALIKIKPKGDLPYVLFGDSEILQVGDWVMAIGNPFGLEQTVTAGIVSAKGRAISNETYGNFIQTDASINPGNSGGPLFNLKGEMVGVNTAIYSQSGGNIGIGFAIPVNMAKNVVSQLKEHGKVVRGWLGVMIQEVSQELAKKFGLERPIGALVGEVVPDSPAAKANLKEGDVIIGVNGKEISLMTMLPAIIAQIPVGEKAELLVVRNGEQKKIEVVIAKLEEDEQASEGGQESDKGRELGLAVQAITPDLAESLGIEDSKGLIITNVEPGSPASAQGLKRGDVIVEINRSPVSSLDEYNRIIDDMEKNDTILLLVKRDRHTRFVVLKKK